VSFLLTVLLPVLMWDKGPETADQLRRAQITEICAPAPAAAQWKNLTGITVEVTDPARMVKIQQPTLAFDNHVASATHAPWVKLNGWRFLREPKAQYLYEAKGEGAALAAAEAYAFGAQAAIHADDAGIDPLAKMLAFLQSAKNQDLHPEANVGFIDDGSAESGEFMNLLVRRNILFRVVSQPDSNLNLNVALGQPDYPRTEAGNPKLLAEKVRSHLTDEKRLLRIYGSEVVVGRLLGDSKTAQLYLINYGALKSPVEGLRIRVLGEYSKIHAAQYGSTNTQLMDVTTSSGGTEFTLPELKTFAIINLAQ
jgi:hypothetical protein